MQHEDRRAIATHHIGYLHSIDARKSAALKSLKHAFPSEIASGLNQVIGSESAASPVQ